MPAFIILFRKNKACIFCQKIFKIYFQILTNCPFVILYNIPLQEINVKIDFLHGNLCFVAATAAG